MKHLWIGFQDYIFLKFLQKYEPTKDKNFLKVGASILTYLSDNLLEFHIIMSDEFKVFIRPEKKFEKDVDKLKSFCPINML